MSAARPVRQVAVIGAGVIGTCTAWYLRERGFEVTVFERREAVAQETSWGNAGVIAPAYVTPWAAPGMPRKILSYLLAPEAPVLFRPVPSMTLARWIGRWLSECELARYRINKARMQRLAFHSRDCLHALRSQLRIDDARRPGYLQLMRTERERAMAEPAVALLRERGVAHAWLDADACRALEPALSADAPLAAGLHLPDDESASCPQFTRALAQAAMQAGVQFRFGSTVRGIGVAGGQVESLQVQGPGATRQTHPADAVVVAGACDALPLLAEHGIHLPIWPVKGYSTTLPWRDPDQGPRRALIDEAYKVAITPMPDGLRLAGTAEVGGRALVPREAALRTLLKVGRDWFPRAAHVEQAQCWVGARPMTPDGPALLGPTPVAGLFINMGHGSTGWAMAAGSGQVVADLVAGRRPEIDIEGLTLTRFA